MPPGGNSPKLESFCGGYGRICADLGVFEFGVEPAGSWFYLVLHRR
jgi:hypothetical protein